MSKVISIKKAATPKKPMGMRASQIFDDEYIPPAKEASPITEDEDKDETEIVSQNLYEYVGGEEFPIQALPLNIQKICTEVAENKSVHAEMIFMHLLALASACIGSRRYLCPCRSRHGTWQEPGTFWGLTIADSGAGKTPTMKLVFHALEAAQIEQERIYNEAYLEYLTELSAWKEREEKDEGDLPPEEPTKVQYYIDDATMESVHAVLMHNNFGVLWKQDEIRGLIKNLNKYNQGDDVSKFLGLHAGFPWTKNRTGNGKDRGKQASDTVPNALASVYGGIQPGVFESFFTADSLFSGMAQRFFFLYPTTKIKKTLMTKAISQNTLNELTSITHRLLNLDEPGKTIYLTDEAFEAYNDFYEVIAAEQPQSFLMKATNNCLRIALLMHYLKTPSYADPIWQDKEEISLKEIEAAIVVTKWFLSTLLHHILPLLNSKKSKADENSEKTNDRVSALTVFINSNPNIAEERFTSKEILEKLGQQAQKAFKKQEEGCRPSAIILGRTLSSMGYKQQKDSAGNRRWILVKEEKTIEKRQGSFSPNGIPEFEPDGT